MPIENKGEYTALILIQHALGFEPRGLPEEALGKLMKSAPINYRFIEDKILDKIEHKGIPVRNPLPFTANWMKIIEDVQTKSEHAPAWIATLLYSEWNFMYWIHIAMKMRILEGIIQKHMMFEIMEKEIQKREGSTRNIPTGTSAIDLVIKWWLDDLVLRIRAVWDRLPYAIAETSEPKIELEGNRHSTRINELEANKQKLGLWGKGEKLFNTLVPELRNIEYVKKYRDAEAHRHTRRTAEIFGTPEKHNTLEKIASRLLDDELHRCREALIATIGIILLR